MSRNVIAIRQMGKKLCWTLVQQAMGMPDVKMQSDFMSEKVALMLFAKQSLPERLCCTAAVRQMDGTTIYEGDAETSEWRSDESRFQTHLLPILGYYFDCLYVYGIDLDPEDIESRNLNFPLINAGGGCSHPCQTLANMACMLKCCKSEKEIKTAWIGNANGTLCSLIEASVWFPFSMKAYIPADNIDALQKRIDELNAPITFVDSPEKAAAGARFIYAGKKNEDDQVKKCKICMDIFKYAQPDAQLLLSASPIRAIPIAEEVLGQGRSLLTLQAQYRLAIHKRILHWVFEKVSII